MFGRFLFVGLILNGMVNGADILVRRDMANGPAFESAAPVNHRMKRQSAQEIANQAYRIYLGALTDPCISNVVSNNFPANSITRCVACVRKQLAVLDRVYRSVLHLLNDLLGPDIRGTDSEVANLCGIWKGCTTNESKKSLSFLN